jgi:hypothetical protein
MIGPGEQEQNGIATELQDISAVGAGRRDHPIEAFVEEIGELLCP